MINGRRETAPLDSQRPNRKSERVRLQKYLAECGLGSRRACERLIDQGAVSIDGEVVSRQGVRVDPVSQSVCVQGRTVDREVKIYVALNKPRNVVCTSRDPEGRKTVHAFLPDIHSRVYPVGRLDYPSEGLLLLTNDGEFAQALTHPRNRVQKTYRVWVDEEMEPDMLDRMIRGMTVDGERLRARAINRIHVNEKGVQYRVVLQQGRKRQIRKMVAFCHRRVKRLQRVAIGSLVLGTLPPGQIRPLNPVEVRRLFRYAGVVSTASIGHRSESTVG